MSTASKKPIFVSSVIEKEAQLYAQHWISNWQQLVNISYMRINRATSTYSRVRNAIYLGALVAALDESPLPVTKTNMALKRYMLSAAFRYGGVVGAIDMYAFTHEISRQFQDLEDCPQNCRTEQGLYKAFTSLVRSGTKIPRYDAFFLARDEAFNRYPLICADLPDDFKGYHMDYNSMTAIMCIAERDMRLRRTQLLTPKA